MLSLHKSKKERTKLKKYRSTWRSPDKRTFCTQLNYPKNQKRLNKFSQCKHLSNFNEVPVPTAVFTFECLYNRLSGALFKLESEKNSQIPRSGFVYFINSITDCLH